MPEARTLAASLSLTVVLALAALVLWPYAAALAWAAVIAYVTWPLRNWIGRRLPSRNLLALLMTILVLAVLLLPLAAVSAALQKEVTQAVDTLSGRSVAANVTDGLRTVPWIGGWLSDLAQQQLQSPGEIERQFGTWIKDRIGRIFAIAGGVGRELLSLSLVFLAVFFFYRDADGWVARLRQAAQRLYGNSGPAYLEILRGAARAVVYGLLVTVLSQGIAAGIGFWIAGVPAPTLLGLTAALFALVPFGPAVPISAAVLWLMLTGSPYSALFLALWGAIAVGSIDNLVRPLAMSKGLQLNYLITTFGVLGGLSLFGLIGLLIGPIALAVLASLMRAWLGELPVAVAPAGVADGKTVARLLQPSAASARESTQPVNVGTCQRSTGRILS